MQFEHGQVSKQQVAEMCFCQRLRDEGARQMKKKTLQHLGFFPTFFSNSKADRATKIFKLCFIHRKIKI